jgi:hypothetical protein
MAESVTNSAAYLQTLLQPNRLQPSSISNADSQQFSQQLAAEVTRQDVATAATEVPAATDDRSSLQNYYGSSSDQQFTPSTPQPTPDVILAAPPSGPSKAQVTLPLLQFAQAGDSSASSADVTGSTDQTAAAPQSQSAATGADPTQQQQQQNPNQAIAGALGPAEELNPLALESITDTIIGVAFAPMQVSQTPPQGGGGTFGRQKDFIFSGHQVFGINYQPSSAAPAASGSTQTVSLDPAPAPKSTPVVAPSATSTSAGSAAYSSTDQTASTAAATPGTGDSRQTLYERAQAIADALGTKSANPQVQQLFSDLASYKAWMQSESSRASSTASTPSVTVTA